MAVPSNGDIYQAGTAEDSSGNAELYIARFLPDGTLDTGFGTNGVTYENVGAGSSPETASPSASLFAPFAGNTSLAITPSGDPVVLTNASTVTGDDTQMAVLEFTQTGTLNTAFGTGGVYKKNVGGISTAPGGLAVQSNGAIVVSGALVNLSGDQEFFAERLTTAGGPDTSFGSNGLFERQLGAGSNLSSAATGVITQSNGDLAFSTVISAPGPSDYEMAVVRLTSSGQLDASFGTNGVADDQPSNASPPDSLALGITATQDGGYAVTGGAFISGATAPAPTVVQFTSAGALDSSFGSDGVFTYPGNVGIGSAVETEPDGKLVVTAYSVQTGTMTPRDLVLRLNTNGTLDSSFGSGGSVTGVPGSDAASIPYAATLTPTGNVLISGVAGGGSDGSSFLQEISLDTAPTVVIAYAPSTVQVGVPVTFTEAATTPNGESVSSVNWDLGSGNFTDGTGTTETKTFTAPGTYTIRVKVTDDAFGLSTTQTQTITVAAAPTVTSTSPAATAPTLSPTVAPAPKLKLVSAKVVDGKIKLKLSCTFAECDVTSSVTTLEHLLAGRTRSLSASGHGKHTRIVKIASGKLVILPGKTATITLKLDSTGVSLLKSFSSLPAKATITLTDSKPVTTFHRSLKVTSVKRLRR